MAVEKPQLSLLERATLALAILRALGVGLITTFTALFRGKSGSAKYKNHIRLAMQRTFLKNTTVRQQQHAGTDLDVAYPAFAKERGFTPKDVTLPDGTKAYWLGSGGYNIPSDPGHLIFVDSLTSSSVSALMLSYTLAPHGTYPRQLQQGVSLLRHALTTLHHSPSTLIIGGDSAGANLTLGVLSHLLHPHPEIEPLTLAPGAALRAAILLAPWASFRHDWPSITTNARKDMVSVRAGDLWAASYLGGRERDAYNEPLSAGDGWWRGLEGVLTECIVTGGGDEILADVIREVGRRLGAVHKSVTVVIAEGEWHDRPTLASMGMGGEQDAAIKSFVKSRV